MGMRTATEERAGLATYGSRDHPGSGLHFDSDGTPFLMEGGEPFPVSQTVVLPIVGESGSSGVFASLANPFGHDVVIVSAVLLIDTPSAGASTLDIGIGANASTSNDNLFDGLSGATGGPFNGAVDGGTNGKGAQGWGASGFLNVAEASGNVNALVARLIVTCVKA